MRLLASICFAALTLSACASGPAPLVENGYNPGALGASAIAREDWAAAEAGLMRMDGVGEDDPARLINLGKVYMATGRTGQALTAWRLALASDRHEMVETMGGQYVSTKTLAERALAAYDTKPRSASR
jgi:hypothetical protein